VETTGLWLGLEAPDKAGRAFAWHASQAGSHPEILARQLEDFEKLAAAKSLVSVRNESGEYVGLIYLEHRDPDWIVGGLIVHDEYRNRGVAKILTYLAIAYILVFEYTAPSGRVLAYVIRGNPGPSPLLRKLGFRPTGDSRSRAMNCPQCTAQVNRQPRRSLP
jgi:RimJ/RimL family protein N-acetyltransferase